MSALGGGLNRSTQHSISFFMLEFESEGPAHAASGCQSPWFPCQREASKKPSTFRHTIRLSPSRQRVLRRSVEPPVISGHGILRFIPDIESAATRSCVLVLDFEDIDTHIQFIITQFCIGALVAERRDRAPAVKGGAHTHSNLSVRARRLFDRGCIDRCKAAGDGVAMKRG